MGLFGDVIPRSEESGREGAEYGMRRMIVAKSQLLCIAIGMPDFIARRGLHNQRRTDALPPGLGTVVRRVRDLGREVHHVVDHAHVEHVSEAAKHAVHDAERKLKSRVDSVTDTEAGSTIGQRLLATFGNPWAKAKREAESVEEKLANVDVKDTLVRAEKKVEETMANVDVKDTLLRAEHKLESAVTPLAVATGEKMDQLRETTADLASRAADEFEHRLETLPARSDPATADATLAARLIETFGNPWTDARKTQQELAELETSAVKMAEQAAREVQVAKEKLAHVDVKETLARAEATLESAVTPLAAAAGEKMDQLRETSTEMAARVAQDVNQRIEALPERADPATNPSLASRLFKTFGNPANDGERIKQEAEQLAERARQEAEHVAQRAEQEWEKLQNVDLEQTLARAEHKVESYAAATGERMDRLRDATMDRAAHFKADVASTVDTASHEIQGRLDALPERGIDRPEQGVDPVLASRLVATFGNAHDDAKVARREVVQLAPGGERTVERVEGSVRGARDAAERVAARAENVVEDMIKEKNKASWWSRS